ncbi:MAG: divalent-cation tolerance protein CutA [Magnetococcales bacterium]|nr:divalent-cation tolerance protein CutA [Magnetococcales bacterium]MBF0419664.1 divalent-cation tolerance protein CutA [Magnetococcales bacterium]MBF0435968.1 divalent-cation tolerance protein CutA [Magnetococcales bacterium]
MHKDKKMVVLWSNAPDKLTAETIARALVEQHLVACVHIFPAGTSIYRWEGTMHQGEEWTMMAKTRRKKAKKAVKELLKAHPYDVPEILITPIIGGLKDYLSWVKRETH